jgi:hypothetical protein
MSDVAQVVAQMAEYGMPPLPANHPVLDGKYKRFGPGKKGWYILRRMTLRSGREVVTGAFGYFQGENRNTVPVKVDVAAMSEDEKAEYVRQQRASERAEQEKREEEIRLAAGRACDQWAKGQGVPVEHPYLVQKQVQAEGLRVSADGKQLLIPLRRGGQLLGLQKIDATGKKRLNEGMDAIGVAHILGTLRGAPIIAVGEGYATCKTARDSVAGEYDLPVAMALNAGNLLHVARLLREAYPDAHLLFLADDDYLLVERYVERLQEDFGVVVPVPIDGATHTVLAQDGERVEVLARWREDAQGIRYIEADMRKGRLVRIPTFKNAGVSSCHAAAREVGNASVAVPVFAVDRAGRKLTDYNDVQIEEGLESVAVQVRLAILAAQQRTSSATASPASAAEEALQPAADLSLAAEQRTISPPAPPAQAAAVGDQDDQDKALLPLAHAGGEGSSVFVPPAPLGAERPEEGAPDELPADFDARFGAEETPAAPSQPLAKVYPLVAPGSAPARGEGEDEAGDKKATKDKPKKVYGDEHWDKVNEVLDNFILIYGEDMVWDCRHRMLMRISAMRTIVGSSDVMKFWSGPQRRWVLKKNIVFDPTNTPSPAESGPIATVNLFNGWPMTPKRGKCIQILTLLSHLCDGNEEMETWIARWLAYPLRNPGAKMETSIIMHGDEGSGKNFFFERVVKPIYGEYGYVIGNDQLESKFNDWASMKLFMVADEVVTRAELKQMKGKLKGLISGDTVIVNPKGLPEHVEKNQMNFVFLSNELQPLALDKTDRRYLVVWTPPALTKEFYQSVAEEIRQGGIEAFYHYLVHELDMGDFDRHTKPIYNDAKDKLIEKSLAPSERFYREWSRGFLPLPFITVAVNQLYEAFRVWCARSGEPMYTSMTKFSPEIERYAGGTLKKKIIKYELGEEVKQRMVFMVGELPDGRTLSDWAEASGALFEKHYQTYRNRGGPQPGLDVGS